ncbi:MAG: ABC transporter substrate-binding protein [Rhodospirillaceae bacterium]|nr:ABC transporter substrate-binding protein [Rhodospirillaceae bacterium]
MNTLLCVAATRFYLKRPWQLCLAIFGIALGVAVYVGVDLANDSARRAFNVTASLINGSTTHQLVGTANDIPNSLYRDLHLKYGVRFAAPVIEDGVRLASNTRRELTVLGIDPLKETEFRGFSSFIPGSETNLPQLISEPGTALLPESLMSELGLERDDELGLLVGNIEKKIRVIGTVRDISLTAEGATAPIIMDIATAQELFNRTTISRIDLILNDSEAEDLTSLDLPNVLLTDANDRNASFDELARAFQTNLTALSLLALLVGVFLIYATMSFAVVQRRKTFGVLRALGVDRNQLLLVTLSEALIIGAIATLLGVLLGHQLANSLVELVLQTTGDFYFRSNVAPATPSILLYIKGFILGVATTLAAAAAPALDAAHTMPQTAISRAKLERSTRKIADRAALISVPISLAALVLLGFSTKSLYLGFIGLFLVIAASTLLIPTATRVFAKLVEPALERSFGISGSLAARGISASLSRTGVATAALTVAVATVIGIGLMVSSFRISVDEWLSGTLTADIYLSTESENVFSNSRIEELNAIQGVIGTSITRFIRVPTEQGELTIRAQRAGPLGWGLSLIEEFPDAIERMESNEGILVSEPLAFRQGLEPGDKLPLPTKQGKEEFTILGSFKDYNTNGGTILMSLSLYRTYWNDEDINGVGVYLDTNSDRENTISEIRTFLEETPSVRYRSTDFIQEQSLSIFDQTFKITEVLRVLAGLVAFLGLFSALMSIEIEKTREVATLRAMGLDPRQIGILTLSQTSLLGLASGLFAIPLGIIMAILLIYVINVRSFGWSMSLVLSSQPLLFGVLLALTASILAGIYPTVRAIKFNVAPQLRDE